jgi:hypothetical protein
MPASRRATVKDGKVGFSQERDQWFWETHTGICIFGKDMVGLYTKVHTHINEVNRLVGLYDSKFKNYKSATVPTSELSKENVERLIDAVDSAIEYHEGQQE